MEELPGPETVPLQLPERWGIWPEVPGVWYLAHVKTADDDAAGLTLAGLPVVLIGRNQALAWSITMSQGDDADLFVERLDAAGERFEDRGAWKPLARRVETIPVKGSPPVERTFLESRHGPLDLVVREGGGARSAYPGRRRPSRRNSTCPGSSPRRGPETPPPSRRTGRSIAVTR